MVAYGNSFPPVSEFSTLEFYFSILSPFLIQHYLAIKVCVPSVDIRTDKLFNRSYQYAMRAIV